MSPCVEFCACFFPLIMASVQDYGNCPCFFTQKYSKFSQRLSGEFVQKSSAFTISALIFYTKHLSPFKCAPPKWSLPFLNRLVKISFCSQEFPDLQFTWTFQENNLFNSWEKAPVYHSNSGNGFYWLNNQCCKA